VAADEEQKDNQIVEEQPNADETMREDNTTPFIVSDKAQGAMEEMKTGLVKDSVKA